MRILIDTSILVRLSHADSEHRQATVNAIRRIPASGVEACLVPQVFYEYWVVVTRPVAQNGLGYSAHKASLDLDGFLKQFTLLSDESVVFENWQALVRRYQVLGKNAHDARLVAAMQQHSIPAILTLNARDFGRYPSITVYTPENLPVDLDNLEGPSV